MMETDDHSHQAKGSVQVGSPMTGIAAIEIEGGEGETSDDIAEHLSRLVGEMSEHLPDDEDDENESPMKGMH